MSPAEVVTKRVREAIDKMVLDGTPTHIGARVSEEGLAAMMEATERHARWLDGTAKTVREWREWDMMGVLGDSLDAYDPETVLVWKLQGVRYEDDKIFVDFGLHRQYFEITVTLPAQAPAT